VQHAGDRVPVAGFDGLTEFGHHRVVGIDVETGTEGPVAGPGNHDRTQPLACQTVHCLLEGREHRGIEGIQTLRTLQGQARDPGLHVDSDAFLFHVLTPRRPWSRVV